MLAILAATPLVARPSFAAPSGVTELAGKLNDPSADVRVEAAARLAGKHSPDARKVLADALVNTDENARLAAARALDVDSQPDPSLIEPLFVALNTTRRDTAEAVTRALARYSDNGDVLTRLLAVATRVPANPISRREVLRVLGSFVDKRAASLLVQVVLDPFEAQNFKTAATDALAEMTATPPSASPDWALWWQQHQNQKDSDFRTGLLSMRSQQLDLLRLRDSQMAGELTSVLRDQYVAFPQNQRTDVLLRYLKSPEPTIRALGTDIATDEARLGQNVANSVRDQLRLMISDSDADVRAGAATAMAKINDPQALSQVLTQLSQEPSPKVRVALARAVGVINDVSAVPQLLNLLNDPDSSVVQAAAYALKDQLAAKIQKENPQLASEAADALQNAFNKLQPQPANEDVRQSLLQPMAPLRQDKLLPLLTRLLSQQRGESAGIKRLALQAIGEIGNAQAAGPIASLLDDNDRSVRLAAVRALGNNPAAAGSAVQLMQRCDPQIETDPAVQGEAWNVVSSLLHTLPDEQLMQFAGRLTSDTEHRLAVLQALAEKLLAENNLSNLAGVRENIGAALMQLNRPDEAATYFKSALDFRQSERAQPMVLDLLAGEYMEALLKAKKYKEAIAFANDIDQDSQYLATIGGKIFDQLKLLTDATPPDLDGAKQLIEQTRLMKPPLNSQSRDGLADIERDVDHRLATKGSGPGSNATENGDHAVEGSGTASGR